MPVTRRDPVVEEAQRCREQAGRVISFSRRATNPSVKIELLELTQRYLDLARRMETAPAVQPSHRDRPAGRHPAGAPHGHAPVSDQGFPRNIDRTDEAVGIA